MRRGFFISFEGTEGCGKSTQIEIFKRRCEAEGLEAIVTREPGGTAVGEEIRKLLQFTPEAANLVPEAELLLFAASRAQLVREFIAPALKRGAIVIADRFLDSTTVYQGIARGLDLEAVNRINRFAAGDCLPDLTLLLDMDSAAAHARALRSTAAGGEADRMESQSPEFYEAVREGYLNLADEGSDRIEVIAAEEGVEEVGEAIWKVFRERF